MSAPASASIQSMLIGSAAPDRLRDWYAEAFGVAPDADGFLQFGSVGVLVVPHDEVGATAAEPGRYLVNIHVPDIKAAAEHLDGLGATWVAAVEYRDAGLWFGTVSDPDGNYVQLIETTPDYFRLKQERAAAAE